MERGGENLEITSKTKHMNSLNVTSTKGREVHGLCQQCNGGNEKDCRIILPGRIVRN